MYGSSGKYDEVAYVGHELITETPPSMMEFARTFNKVLKKYMYRAGWPKTYVKNYRPRLVPSAPKGNNPFKASEPNSFELLQLKYPYGDENEALWVKERSKSLTQQSKTKRIFCFEDFEISNVMAGFLQSLNVTLFFESAPSPKDSLRKRDFAPLCRSIDYTLKLSKATNWPRDLPEASATADTTATTTILERKVHIGNQHHIARTKYVTDPMLMLKEMERLFQLAGKEVGGEVNAVVKLVYSRGQNYLSIQISTKEHIIWRIQMSDALYRILGIRPEQLESGAFITPDTFTYKKKSYNDARLVEIQIPKDVGLSKRLRGANKIDLTRGVESLWIYSNIIKPSIVGHSFVPLLRVVPLKKKTKNNGVTVATFTHPYYHPLALHTLTDVEIKIYNTYGKTPIAFASDVICMLHVRKRKQHAALSIKGTMEGESASKRPKLE